MKIVVFADSHGRNAGMFYVIERERPDSVIHLGDYAEDADELARAYPALPVYRVRGNNDYASDAPLNAVVTPDNVPLYLTHGHKERVSMLSPGHVARRAREEKCAVAFYGHTHRALLERSEGGVWVCNPGSISLPRGGPASYARLIIEDHKARLLELLDEDGERIGAERL